MAYNQNQAGPFWDFVRSLDGHKQHQHPQGEGVDYTSQGFEQREPPHHGPFGPGMGIFGFGGQAGPGAWGGIDPWDRRQQHGFGRRGRGCGPRGRHCGRREGSRSPSPGHGDRDVPEGEGEASGPEGPGPHPHSHGPHHRGPRGLHGRRGGHRGPLGGFGGPGGFSGPGGAPFDLSAILGAFAQHPIAQALRTYAEQATANTRDSTETAVGDEENTFIPPIDIFSTPTAYILHIALPGAKKEDVGVNWDAEKSELNVAGVVYRQGDEEFLKALSKAERKVGVFERSVKLPPSAEDKDEVDGDGIAARLEDGVLVVTVPKVEKEWTEVKKVDIL